MNRSERVLAGATFALMALLMVFDVLSRELFRYGLPWAQKLAVFAMIWGGFIGASLTSAAGGHLRPEIADKLWSRRLQPAVKALEHALIALFCFGLGVAAFQYVMETRQMGDVGVVTRIPLWIVQIVIPYTFFSMSIRHAVYAFFPKVRPEVKRNTK